ncbi:MAG TPA: hypothetical protein VER76_17410, partial [Pyrinomonadaceae bacterium]|nr:hypothetical protein [Pyrinomonadaceae bacterium]
MQDISLDSGRGARDATTGAGADFKLGIADFTYGDLYRPQRLGRLTAIFYAELYEADPALHDALTSYTKARGATLKGTKAESDLLIAAAPHLSRFVARLFGVERERAAHMERIKAQDAVFAFKNFIMRRAVKRVPPEKALTVDAQATDAALDGLRRAVFPDTQADDAELAVARMTVRLLAWEEHLSKPEAAEEDGGGEVRREMDEAYARAARTEAQTRLKQFEIDAGGTEATDERAAFVKAALRLIETWASVHATQEAAKSRVRGWVSFRVPHPLNYEHLVQLERPDAELPERMRGLEQNLRRRDGFGLTDQRATRREVLDEVHYCLYCHERDKDSC